jgi:hypothetical protein
MFHYQHPASACTGDFLWCGPCSGTGVNGSFLVVKFNFPLVAGLFLAIA